MDERIVKIVKATARGQLAEYAGAAYCMHCSESPYSEVNLAILVDMIHEPECIVTIARQLMVEWGMPLNIYQVRYQRRQLRENGKPLDDWQPFIDSQIAFAPEDVLSQYAGNPLTEYRNVAIKFMRVFPLEAQ